MLFLGRTDPSRMNTGGFLLMCLDAQSHDNLPFSILVVLAKFDKE